ncbi:MAG: methionyl-tRNA formyltransferase [Oscillospiraceae bacterium]|nr:methionyl-tRNA formyltransferase [Oscillospiraceae bacterium]
MRIIFMGTPEFAVPCLKRLVEDGHELAAVFTQPDKPKGRRLVLTPPPVKRAALEAGLRVEQPVTLRDGTASAIFEELRPELAVVVAYGKLLPPELLDLPKHGCINLHASLLPKYRGAAPIQWAILNGERESGVSTMRMDAGLDTGDILLQDKIEIPEDMTAAQLHDQLSLLGARTLQRTLDFLQNGALKPVRQDDAMASCAPMLSRAHSPLDWNRPARELYNQVRGLQPWPCATAVWNGKTLRVRAAQFAARDTRLSPGEFIVEGDRLFVCCGDGNLLELLEVQQEGKKAMDTSSFLRGIK